MRAVTRSWQRGLVAVIAGIALALVVAGPAGASVSVGQSGWAWGNPSPQGNTLRSIAFAGPLGYAVGDNGTALKTLDGGATWSGLATGTSGQLTRVQIVDPETVVVASSNGCVLRISTNGGAVFTRIFTVAEANCPDQVQAFSFISSQVGFLLLRNGSVLATHDGGQTFSRETGVPSTAASSGGGGNVGIDIHFSSPTNGIVIVGPPSGGQSVEYSTSDGGVSWTPVTLPSANITSVHFVDPTHAFAIGPNTMLSSADAGATWTAQPIGGAYVFNSIDCADAKTCVMTVTAGDRLVRTSDGGATSSVTTASSGQIFAAGYASATRVVGVGSSGTTVVSGDGGATFASGSSDIGGEYSKLVKGPGGIVAAPGTNGILALSTNSGASWSTLATQTSANLIDVAFASTAVGYALDQKGGLQSTNNGGTSWRTLDPGTSRPAEAVATVGSNSVLLVGPVGIYRSVAGGRFNPVTGKVVARARLSHVEVVGSTAFAYGQRALVRSSNGGASWNAIRLPQTNKKGHSSTVIRSVSFVSASVGLLLDEQGRLWRTRNGGGSWSEMLSTGTSSASGVAFADPQHAFLTLPRFGSDTTDAYVLHTADGGATWHPQVIAAGLLDGSGLAAEGPNNAYALVDGPSIGGKPDDRQFFFTGTGGDAGTAGSLSISTKTRQLTKKKLNRAHRVVRIDGLLKGAQGGEQIIVSRRNLAGGRWQQQTATAGANGGSFTTTWHISASSVFVAQWAGDSGRQSLGSSVLRVTVR
ncbi:MAG TPA: hypothetical protein VGF47_04315 [Solirubrobacteraceae bacterium]